MSRSDPDRPDAAAGEARTFPGTGLLRAGRTELRDRVPRDVLEARVLARAEGLLGRLEAVSDGLQRVTRLQEQILKRLLPVVDDLGELVRHQLDEARQRRGLAPRARPEPSRHKIIDHEPEAGSDPSQ
jgi:hypothetical protein